MVTCQGSAPSNAESKADTKNVVANQSDEIFNLKSYGAKGLGVISYKDDSAALVNAIKAIKNKGGGKLYIPSSTSFYGFNGDGILLPDNIEIYGDGPQSEIKHINPANCKYYKGVIFYTTTYGPNSSLSIVREPSYPIKDAAEQQHFVVAKKASDVSKLKQGIVIGLGGKLFFKKNQEFKPRYNQFELNEVTRVHSDTVFLKYPLSVPLETDGESPVIIDVNGDHTYNEKIGVYDRVSKNIYIHDMKFSQADHNMINNTPYFSEEDKAPFNMIALGGTFESKFENLTLDGFGTFGGNMWNRCDISHLKIFSARKFTDLGYGSANTKIHNIEWTFKGSKADTSSRSLAYLNDGTHHIEIYDIKIAGAWSGNNLVQMAGGSHHLYLHDIKIDLPAFNGPSNFLIGIVDDNESVYVHDITFENISIKVGVIGQYIKIRGKSETTNKKILFNNVQFEGEVASKRYSVYISNSPDISLENVTVSQGDIYISNVKNAKIKNLKASNSVVVSDDPSMASRVKNDPSNKIKSTQTATARDD
jgi:hypothetical protein